MNRNHHPQLYSASPVASKRNVLDSPTNPLSSKRLSENSNPPEAVQTDEKEGTTESVFKTPDSEGLSIPTANNENEFYRFVDGPVGKTLTAIFENELLSIEEKIACSDPIIHRTPIESQYLYRKWRFKNTEPSKRVSDEFRLEILNECFRFPNLSGISTSHG
ncbi:hypothetical protein WR25_06809 isoform B [Diploscapter pachys]|uniref:Uncharacterized protein n=1 Tax=Diploscapter pachys TaxID=2018661 RepID=A0A2A2LN15_9BILA|nr:hypothetical protein WR25_06809 isoform B [Diploscapter pachys]